MRPKKVHRVITLSALLGMAATAAAIVRFPPTLYAFYPRCPVYTYLHVACPGCGATRATAALLHGHPAEALHRNAPFVATLPLLIGYIALSCYRAWTTDDDFRWPELPVWTTFAMLTASVIFTIIRNLPS